MHFIPFKIIDDLKQKQCLHEAKDPAKCQQLRTLLTECIAKEKAILLENYAKKQTAKP